MQPYFFPYIGYFQLIKAVDTFVVFDDVNYIKKGWINRNAILVNGGPHLFTMSLVSASQNKHINAIQIDENSNWKSDLLKCISFSYKKAPFFEEIYTLLAEIIVYEDSNLSSYIIHSLKKICAYLYIETNFISSSELNKDIELKAQDKIINICKLLGAQKYINPIGGIELYDKNTFLKEEVMLSFIKTNTFSYKQYNNPFIENLSIIDVLMFNDRSTIATMLDNYTLIS